MNHKRFQNKFIVFANFCYEENDFESIHKISDGTDNRDQDV
jgi:hypothetical protein